MAYLRPGNVNDFIEQKLDEYLGQLGDELKADALAFSGGIIFGVDDAMRGCVEEMKRTNSGRNKLAVVLTTGGGYIEVAQRIADTFRKHYQHVEFIVPNYAYSAGTVLVMCGDVIWMDYYSRLGPIDPQIQNKSGRMVPALGYLRQYERLIEKAKAKPPEITDAEVELLISGFDQAELYQFEQSREQSITLLEEWLAKYKFKDWTVTQTRKSKVTPRCGSDGRRKSLPN
jgi:ClpP class serine protease